MRQFSIRMSAAHASVNAESNWINLINQDKNLIKNVKSSIHWKISSENQIKVRLDRIIQNTDNIESTMRDLQKALENVINQYEYTENTILKNDIFFDVNVEKDELSDNSNSNRFNAVLKDIEKMILDIIGKAGPAGKSSSLILAVLKMLIDGDGISGKDIGNLIKGSRNSIIGLMEIDTSDLKKLFGLDECKTISLQSAKAGWIGKLENVKTTFVDTWKDQLSPFKEISKTEKVLNGTKIAGWTLDLVANGISNYEEFNGFSERMIAETVTETFVDIGKRAAFTAITAGAAALIGVPALTSTLAVGGAAVAASVVADIVCESITEKNLTEFISDELLDRAAERKDAIKTATNSVAGWLEKIGNNIGRSFKTAFA